jgi:hypothetical protein
MEKPPQPRGIGTQALVPHFAIMRIGETATLKTKDFPGKFFTWTASRQSEFYRDIAYAANSVNGQAKEYPDIEKQLKTMVYTSAARSLDLLLREFGWKEEKKTLSLLPEQKERLMALISQFEVLGTVDQDFAQYAILFTVFLQRAGMKEEAQAMAKRGVDWTLSQMKLEETRERARENELLARANEILENNKEDVPAP